MFSSKGSQRQKKSQRTANIPTPTQIYLKQKCHKVVAGPLHSYAISENSVFLWGKKMAYNLKESSRSMFSQANDQDKVVEIPIKVENVATGPNHSFAWNERQVYCWGSNENYELGLEEQRQYSCQKIEIFEQAMKNGYHLQQIECGQSHTLAVFRVPEFQKQEELFPNNLSQITEKEEDIEEQQIQMFAWGKSQSYQLAINSVNIIPYPVLAPCSFRHLTSVHSKSDYNVALCNGKVYSWGANLFSRLGNVESKVRIPLEVALPARIRKIGIGNHHVVAVSVDGAAYSWGKGDHGQLGISRFQTQSHPTKVHCEGKILDAACGDLHTLIRLQNNQLMTCGGNKYGALGHNNYDAADKKKRCKGFQPVQNQQILGNILMIACGNHHNLVLNSSGEVFGWGSNSNHQVMPNLENNQLVRLEISSKDYGNVNGFNSEVEKSQHKVILESQEDQAYSNQNENPEAMQEIIRLKELVARLEKEKQSLRLKSQCLQMELKKEKEQHEKTKMILSMKMKRQEARQEMGSVRPNKNQLNRSQQLIKATNDHNLRPREQGSVPYRWLKE